MPNENPQIVEQLTPDDGAQNENTTTDTNSTSKQENNNNKCGCNKKINNGVRPVANPDQVVGLATSLAIALTQGKTFREVETLINFFSVLNCSLRGILEQRAINSKRDIEIIID